jgi:hypothetical protein
VSKADWSPAADIVFSGLALMYEVSGKRTFLKVVGSRIISLM